MADVRQLKIDIMADAKNFIKSFEGALQKIEKTADNIDFLDGLTKDADKIKALIEEINLHSLDADASEVTQKIDLINNALNSIKNTVKTLDFRINGLEDFLSTEGQISHLMDEVNGLANAYKNLAKASEAFSKREFDLYNIGDTKDLERQFRRALELYEEFDEASQKNKSGNYSNEYKQTAEDLYKYIALIRRVDELTKKANGKSYLQNVQVLDRGNIVEEATSIMSDVEKIIGEKATKINSSFSKMASNNIPFLNAKAVKKMQTEVTNYTLKNGSVIVPVKLKDGVYSEIEKQVSQIIGQLNQKGIDNPVTIQLKIDEEKLTKITDTIKTKIMAIQKDLTDATKGVIQETGISQQIKSMNLTNDTIPALISKINTVNAELELMQDDLQKVSAELDTSSQKAKDSIKVNTNSKAFKEYISEIKEVAKVLTELNNKFGDKGIKLNIEETSLERVNTQLSEMYQLLQRTNGLVDNSRLSLAFKNLKTQLNDLFDSKKITRTAKGAISETKKNVEELDNFFKEFIERYKKQGGNFNVADLVSNDIDKQKLSKLYEDFLSRNEGMRKIVEDAQNKKMTEIPITVDGQGLKAKIRQELKSEKFVIDVTPNINVTNFTGKIESALDNKQVEVNVTPNIANTRIRAEEKKEEKPLDKSKVVYHWGKLGSSTQPSHTFGQEGKIRNGGTGTYVVSDLSSFANVNTNITKFNSTDKGKKFFAIDTSALKLFKPESQEAADAFQKFLHQLDQFILNTTKLFPQFEKDLEGVNEQTLFDSAKKIFPEFKMDFEQFSSWISSMSNIAKLGIQNSGGRANIRTDRIKQEYGVDDFKTRFLKQLGYQGYDLSNTSYNNLEHGSVLFDNAAKEASVASAESIEELEKILLQKFKASVGNVGREAKKAVIDSTPATTNVAADTGTKITNKTDAVITPQIQTEEIISTQEVQNLATLEATILRIKNALKEKTGAIVAEDSQFQSEITNLSNLETKVKGIKENLAEISKIELSNIKNNLQNTEQNSTDKSKNVVEDIKPNQQSQQSQQPKETKTTASLDLTNVKEDIEEQTKDIKIPVKIVPDTKELKSSIQNNLDSQKFNIKIDGRIKNGELRIAAPVQKTEQNKEVEQEVLITPKMDGFVEKIQSNLNNKSVNIKVNPIVDDDFKNKIGDLVKGNVVENKENSQNDNSDNNLKNNKKDNRKKATKSSKSKEKLKEEGSFLKEPDKKTSMSKDSKSSTSLKANSDKVLSKAEQELEDWLANSVQDFLGVLEVHKNGRVAKGQGELLYKFKKEIFEPYKQSGGQKELQDLFPNNKNIQKMIKGARPSNPNGSNRRNDIKNNLNELAKKTEEVEKEQEKKPKYTQEDIENRMDEYIKGFLNQIEFNNNKTVKKGQDKKFENFLDKHLKMYQNEGGDQHGQRTLEELFGDNKNVLKTFQRIIKERQSKKETVSKEEQKTLQENILSPLLEQAQKNKEPENKQEQVEEKMDKLVKKFLSEIEFNKNKTIKSGQDEKFINFLDNIYGWYKNENLNGERNLEELFGDNKNVLKTFQRIINNRNKETVKKKEGQKKDQENILAPLLNQAEKNQEQLKKPQEGQQNEEERMDKEIEHYFQLLASEATKVLEDTSMELTETGEMTKSLLNYETAKKDFLQRYRDYRKNNGKKRIKDLLEKHYIEDDELESYDDYYENFSEVAKTAGIEEHSTKDSSENKSKQEQVEEKMDKLVKKFLSEIEFNKNKSVKKGQDKKFENFLDNIYGWYKNENLNGQRNIEQLFGDNKNVLNVFKRIIDARNKEMAKKKEEQNSKNILSPLLEQIEKKEQKQNTKETVEQQQLKEQINKAESKKQEKEKNKTDIEEEFDKYFQLASKSLAELYSSISFENVEEIDELTKQYGKVTNDLAKYFYEYRKKGGKKTVKDLLDLMASQGLDSGELEDQITSLDLYANAEKSLKSNMEKTENKQPKYTQEEIEEKMDKLVQNFLSRIELNNNKTVKKGQDKKFENFLDNQFKMYQNKGGDQHGQRSIEELFGDNKSVLNTFKRIIDAREKNKNQNQINEAIKNLLQQLKINKNGTVKAGQDEIIEKFLKEDYQKYLDSGGQKDIRSLLKKNGANKFIRNKFGKALDKMNSEEESKYNLEPIYEQNNLTLEQAIERKEQLTQRLLECSKLMQTATEEERQTLIAETREIGKELFNLSANNLLPQNDFIRQMGTGVNTTPVDTLTTEMMKGQVSPKFTSEEASKAITEEAKANESLKQSAQDASKAIKDNTNSIEANKQRNEKEIVKQQGWRFGLVPKEFYESAEGDYAKKKEEYLREKVKQSFLAHEYFEQFNFRDDTEHIYDKGKLEYKTQGWNFDKNFNVESGFITYLEEEQQRVFTDYYRWLHYSEEEVENLRDYLSRFGLTLEGAINEGIVLERMVKDAETEEVKKSYSIFGVGRHQVKDNSSANLKTSEAFSKKIVKEQSNLDKWISNFNSKSLGRFENTNQMQELTQLTITPNNYDAVIEKIAVLKNELETLYGTVSQYGKVGKSSLNPMVDMLTAADKSEHQINKFAESYSKLSISSEDAQTTLSTLANLLFLIQEAQSQLDTDKTGEQLVNLSKYMAQFRLESIKMTEELGRLNRINKDANGKGFKKLIEDMSLMPNPNSPDFDIDESPLINQYVDTYDFLSNKIIKINELMGQLPNMKYGSEEYQKQIALIKKMIKDSASLQRELNSSKYTTKNEFGTIVKGASIQDRVLSPQEARQSIDDILSNYKVVEKIKSTSKISANGDELIKFTTQIQNAKGEIETLAFTYDSAMGTIRQATLKVEQPVSLLESLFNRVSAKWQEVAAFIMTHMSFYRIISELKQGFSIIRQFDDALTEMQKVSNETITTLRDFQKTSFDLADSVGSDALTIQNSTAEWMRLGESLEDAQKSAQTAAILFNVSEFESINEATQSLVAMSAAYEDANIGLDKMDIVDKLNKVGNDFSISTDGLATALQNSASALTTTGATIDEAIALITAGNAVTQDPSKVGAGLRTIALRLTGTQASRQELEENGEEVEGMITNVSKLRDTILQATKVEANNFKGFDILNDVGAYKSPYEIMLGLADIYKDIEEQDKKTGSKQANLLLETIAGKTRANIAASILQNPDILRQAYTESENSSGSALEENEKYMESISGHIQAIKNEWQQIWANSANRELINFFLDLAKAILEVVENIGLLGTALTVGTGISSLKWLATGKGSVAGIIGLLGDFAKKEREVNGIRKAGKFVSNGFTSVESIEDVIEGTGKFTSNGFTSVKNIGDVVEGAGKFTSNGFTSVENIGDVVEDTSEGLKDLGDSAENLGGKAGVVGRLGELASNIGTLLPYIVGLVAAIAGAIIAFQTFKKISDKMNLSLEETREEAKTLVDNYRSERKNTSTHKQKIDEVSDRYEELSRGVNLANNQNLTLTNEEYSEYLSICNDIAEMYPKLVSGYDAQGNAILKLKGNVEQLTEAYKQEQVESARTLLQGGENKEDAKSIWDNFVHQRKGTWMQRNAAAGMYADEEKEYLDSLFDDYLRDAEGTQKQIENVFDTYFLDNGKGGNKDISNKYTLLKSLGFSRNMSDAEFEDAMIRLQTESEDIKLKIEENEQFVREMIQARAEVNDTYQSMTEDEQQMVDSIFGNISEEKLYEYTPDDSGYAKITQDVNDTIKIVNQALNSNESVFDEQWQNILNQDNLDYVIDDYENSLNKLEELGYKQQDVIDLINQDAVKVGNVNLSTDRAINWGEDPTKNKNFANLQTWYDESAEQLAKDFKNTTSTVLGTSKYYNKGNDDLIELSLAMITEDGEILSQDTVDQYINNIIHTANENGEPITIDTILKYDSKENGGMNIVAGEGENASFAMHEIEVLKGFGNVEGAYATLDKAAQQTGHSINDFITEYNKIGKLKGIDTFQDVYDDMLGLGSGKGNLANAKSMGEFEEIANTYRQIFIDQMGEDTGAEIFDSIFDDQGRGDLTKNFSDMLKQKWLLDPNSSGYQKYMEQFENYSYDEAKAYANAFSKIDSLSDAEIQQEFSKGLRDTAAGAYQATLNIEEETAAINTLNSAMASSNGATGLSSEEVTNVEALYKDLAGYDASELFESTANGIHLNQKELRKLNKEYQKSKVKQQSKQYDELQKQLSDSKEALKGLKAQYEQGDTSILDEINAENRRKEGIEENINALEREMAQYSALTSAYNQYVNAQASANENAKYENIQTGYDTAKDLIERGWGGMDDVRAYVNMFTQEDMMTAPVDKVIAKFNELDDKVANTSYSMKDFFTVDSDGKSTSEGIFNFLDVVKAKAKQEMPELGDAILDQLVSVDEAGIYSFDFDILGGDQKVADMLGVDLSLLQAIIQAAQDAGFEVQMTDALPGLQGLTQEMVNMRAELIRLGGDAEKFDFNVLSVDVEGKDGKTPEFDNKVKEIQETIETLKNSDLNDPQTFAALNYANSQLDVLIEKRARFLADSQMGDMGVDLSTVSEKYQQVGVLLDDFLLKQNRLNEASRLGLDTSDFESELNSAQKDFYNALATFSSDELNEIGLHFTADFDELTPEEKAEEIKKQFEKEEVTLHLNTETDTPQDPTKGMNGQHVVVEVQFTMNGETVAIEAINTVTEAAEGVPNETNTTMNVDSEEAEAKTNKYGEVLEEATKDRSTRLISNSDGEKKRVKSYIGSLDAIPSSVRSNVVVSGLSSATTGAKDLAKNLANLSGKTIKTYIQQITEKKTVYTGSRAGMPSNVPRYNGTAHAYGTITKFSRNNAYANGRYSGNWGVPQDEDALVNELGEELIIHDGKWRIANNGNMGFTHLEKGDIVLNHKQTEELLKKGYVSNSRGVLVGGFSHAMGTTGDAFSLGTGAGRTAKKTTTNNSNKSSGNKKSGGNNNSNKKSNNNSNNNNTAETFDWVEVKIQRIEEAIAQLDSIIDSVYNTWDTRNNNLNKDLIKVGEEIDLQKRAIETYKNYLDTIGLSQTYINKIKKGELRIEDIKDDKLKEKIQKYQEYYNKVVQCQTSITELKEREKELVAQRFDNYQTWYEERLQDLDFRIEMMETLSDRAEKSGRLMSGYYAGIMRDTEEARIKVLQREYNQLVLELEQATNSNTIAKWSEQWYEMCDSIDEVSQAIAEAENNVIEYQNTIREYEWERFDKTLDRIGQIADETEWLNELLEESKSFEEETGRYTESGSARMGLLAIQYDTYLNESARYAAELKNIEKDIAKDPYNQDLLDRRKELLEAQRDAISNALKERDAIKSLVEEGIEAQLNALQKLIDKYKEALQSQKDLYDYQNNVTESADEISRLQKLISAYQGDDSEESRLKVQQYQKELKDAQKSLYDTQYDRNISDTEEALDKLYEQYEETLNKALDDVDKLIGDVIKGVNSGSQNIVDTIKEAADKYGYTLTDSMSTIVSSINKLVSEDIKKNISSSDTGYNNAPNSGVDTASNNISQNVNEAVQKSFKEAEESYKDGKATSIIKKNFLSNDRKSYTDAEGRTIQFTKAVAKGKDDFVNDTKGNQYYFDEGGNLVGYGGGLQTIHGYKYYTDGKDNKGALQTGWQQVGDKWYYFYKSTMKQYKDHYKGVAATGWQDIDGETYYFDKSGVMQTGRWKDRKIGDKKYYRYWLKDNGKAFKNTSVKMGKTTYHFDKNGYLLDKKGGKPKVFTSAQYKTGVYGLTQDQLAWTQENKKEEAIIRPSDGAILTPLSHGDSVLNAKATKALFEFANNPDEYFKSYTDGSNYNDVPTINNTMNGDMNIQFNINGANITDYDTFKKQLTSDPQFERLLRSMTTDRLFGGSSLKKYKI